jgi:hypothetical protein
VYLQTFKEGFIMTSVTRTREESNAITQTIRAQIGVGTFMSLGAGDLTILPEGLRFTARIKSFNSAGLRGAVRRMFVDVTLNGLDLYDVRVTWIKGLDIVDHYVKTDVPVESLSRILLALDYDGERF